jgi:hypothetical protein
MSNRTENLALVNQTIQRSVLPVPDQPYKGTIVYDAKNPDAKFPPIQPIRPPKEAPNVLLILLDDVGFGASSAFGGPINTPVAEDLAANWVWIDLGSENFDSLITPEELVRIQMSTQ